MHMATVSGMFNPTAFEQRGISVSNKATPADTTLYMRAQQAASAQAAPPTDNAAFSKISGKNVPVSTELLAAQEETSSRRIAVSSVKRLDATLTPMRIAELPEKEYQGALEALERMFEGISLSSENLIWPDDSYLANHPATKEYATVKVGNTVVATLDNQGTMSTSNATYEKLKGRVPDDVNGKSGPILA